MTKPKRRPWEYSAKYILLLPSMAVFVILSFYPLIYSFIFSLTDWNMSSPNPPRFVGVENYVRMIFRDSNFWLSLKATFLFIGGIILGELILGLGLALLLNREFKGKNIVRTIFIMPVMITPVVVGIIWRLLYNPDMGILNYILGYLGISPKIWLGTVSKGWVLKC
ncbi:MAG: sugar ABC transporter permease [Bacteroidia bacterium]|nr:sugar ABC transporter permease [Bacteroidia bacterium]